ncbi:unnamed protein product [Euphydryas editha]|uniref:Reverse transcriptase n=1 Tax=Euphydryas editha TaxID=104508 RepID=A0AAU9V7S9_EUPED|nr:unnamed protein product [Euphydryas editha]
MKRKRRVTYRLTHVMTGHEFFGEYLRKIGCEATAICHHCDANLDIAHHALESCPALEAKWQTLVREIEQDLLPLHIHIKSPSVSPSWCRRRWLREIGKGPICLGVDDVGGVLSASLSLQSPGHNKQPFGRGRVRGDSNVCFLTALRRTAARIASHYSAQIRAE